MLDALQLARGPSKLQGSQHLRHDAVPARGSPNLGRSGSSLRARAMLVSGPIATSKSSPGAALAASTSLRGAKPAGQRHQMWGQKTAWAAACSVSARLAPASSSAGQTYTGRAMHTQVCVKSDWPGQQLVTTRCKQCRQAEAWSLCSQSCPGQQLIRPDAHPGREFVWGS